VISVTNINIRNLRPADTNPNVMDGAHYKALVAGIKAEGFLQPILVREIPDEEQGTAPPADAPEYEIVDGHHRVRAAEEAGMLVVPAVIAAPGMSLAAARLQAIGMNKRRGELDLTEVGRAFADLHGEGWSVESLALTGFSENEVGDLLRSVSQDVDKALAKDISVPAGSFDDDDAQEPTAKPFLLEILFTDRDEFKAAKRGLKRAAGKGKDLARGLLVLLGEDAKKGHKS
jgi:ParB/RepB/Spo0J family partition protein